MKRFSPLSLFFTWHCIAIMHCNSDNSNSVYIMNLWTVCEYELFTLAGVTLQKLLFQFQICVHPETHTNTESRGERVCWRPATVCLCNKAFAWDLLWGSDWSANTDKAVLVKLWNSLNSDLQLKCEVHSATLITSIAKSKDSWEEWKQNLCNPCSYRLFTVSSPRQGTRYIWRSTFHSLCSSSCKPSLYLKNVLVSKTSQFTDESGLLNHWRAWAAALWAGNELTLYSTAAHNFSGEIHTDITVFKTEH